MVAVSESLAWWWTRETNILCSSWVDLYYIRRSRGGIALFRDVMQKRGKKRSKLISSSVASIFTGRLWQWRHSFTRKVNTFLCLTYSETAINTTESLSIYLGNKAEAKRKKLQIYNFSFLTTLIRYYFSLD